METFLEYFINHAHAFSYIGIVVALLITSIGFPIPEDVILLTAGFITAEGRCNVYLMIILTMLAILVGDFIMYALGYYFGQKIFRVRPFCWVFTPARQERIKNFYTKHGRITIFVGRFAAGLRAGIYLLAGASKMRAIQFLFMDFLAAIISVPILVWLGFFFSTQIKEISEGILRTKELTVLVVLLTILTIILYRRISRRRQAVAQKSTI